LPGTSQKVMNFAFKTRPHPYVPIVLIL